MAEGAFDYEKINSTVEVLKGQFDDFNSKSTDLVKLITKNIKVGGAVYCEGTSSMVSSWGTSIAAVDGFGEILNEWAAALEGEINDIQKTSERIKEELEERQKEANGIVDEAVLTAAASAGASAYAADVMGELARANQERDQRNAIIEHWDKKGANIKEEGKWIVQYLQLKV